MQCKEIFDALSHVKLLASGRTRFEGQQPFSDEILVAYIKQLRDELDLYWNSKRNNSVYMNGTCPPPMWSQAALYKAFKTSETRLMQESEYGNFEKLF